MKHVTMKQREETAGVLSFHVPLREPEKAGGEKGGRTIETMFAACPELFLTKMFAVQRMLVVQKTFVGQRGGTMAVSTAAEWRRKLCKSVL